MSLTVQKDNESIHITYKEKTLLRHTRQNPALRYGTGKGKFQHHHGNFRIKEQGRARKRKGNLFAKSTEGSELLISCGEAVEMRFREGESFLSLDFPHFGESYNRLDLSLSLDPSAAVYGCGEQYSYLNLKGRRVPLWTQEQGIGRGKGLITLFADIHSDAGGGPFSTYFPMTSFVTGDGLWVVVETTGYAVFNFKKKDHCLLEFWQVPEKIIIGRENTLSEALKAQSSYLGRQPMLPEWTYDGMWLGVQGGTDIVEAKLKKALDAGVVVSSLWAQDWEGKRITSFGKQLMWNWRYDPSLYPDLPGYIASLKKRGVGFLGYINPFLAVEGDLYKDASVKGFCIQRPEGGDYLVEVTTFPAAILDLTNPEAVEWIKGVIKENMIGIGLSGWMADFGEYLPADAVLYSGESAELVHNRYPVDWARVNYEALEEAGKLGELVYFMRAGFTGSVKWSTAYWAGDQLVDWSRGDGLPTAITAGISAGLSGVGYYHSDIGGYTSLGWIKRKKEVFQRWAEFSAFTQIMRSHEGNRPDTSWQFDTDQDTLRHLAAMTRVYASLKPYHIALSREYQETGIAPIRPVALHYPDDDRLKSLKYQYLYGRDLLVAPVIKKGVRRWKVYLPEETWIGFWNQESFEGGKIIEIAAPLGKPPVFFRKGSTWVELFRQAALAGEIEPA